MYSDLDVSVSGTIETDGTVGNLDASNIRAWSLSFTDGYETFAMSDGSAGLNTSGFDNWFEMSVVGNTLQASSFLFHTRVSENESLVATRFHYETSNNRIVFDRFTKDLTDNTFAEGFIGHDTDVVGQVALGQESQNVTLGLLRAPIAAVPLPAGGLLLGSVIAGFGAVGMRRRRKSA